MARMRAAATPAPAEAQTLPEYLQPRAAPAAPAQGPTLDPNIQALLASNAQLYQAMMQQQRQPPPAPGHAPPPTPAAPAQFSVPSPRDLGLAITDANGDPDPAQEEALQRYIAAAVAPVYQQAQAQQAYIVQQQAQAAQATQQQRQVQAVKDAMAGSRVGEHHLATVYGLVMQGYTPAQAVETFVANNRRDLQPPPPRPQHVVNQPWSGATHDVRDDLGGAGGRPVIETGPFQIDPERGTEDFKALIKGMLNPYGRG